MTWEYHFDEVADETTIYWNDNEVGSIDGEIDQWRKGYPTGDAREVVFQAIQSADTSERNRMQFYFNYGFQEIREE